MFFGFTDRSGYVRMKTRICVCSLGTADRERYGCFMKYINQLMLILGISFVGELLNYFLPFPLPASVYGLLILFVCLLTGIIKLSQVEDVSQYMIAVMPIFFIEPSVGLIESMGIVGNSIVTILLAALLSTIAVFAVTGLGAQAVIRYQKKKKGDKNNELE